MNLIENNTAEEIEEVELSEAETKEQILNYEGSLLDALLDAADYASGETLTIEIIRNKTRYFTFDVHPISEEDFFAIRKKYTKYKKNRKNGIKYESELDASKYRCSIIYNCSTEKSQAEIWDNKALWDALRKKGYNIVNALDVVETLLLPGEKDMVCDAIDKLCGYSEENMLVEEAKNS